MGSPISPVVVNLYMEKSEEKTISFLKVPFRPIGTDGTWVKNQTSQLDGFFHNEPVNDYKLAFCTVSWQWKGVAVCTSQQSTARTHTNQ